MIDQKVLIKLIDRLNQYPVGLPDSPEIREFLEIFLTPDEALLASTFPLREASAKELSEKIGWELEKTNALLETMASKGTVVDFILKKDHQYWMLTPSVIGFIEFSLMKVHKDKPMKRMAKLLEKYETETFWKELFGSKTQLTRALVEYDVPVSSQVVTTDHVEEVIKNAGGGAIQNCFCRHQAKLLGNPCKLADFEGTCISLGNSSSFVIRRGFGRRASVDELIKLTRRLGEKGLIHITDNIRDKPTFICNCCGCCCGLLKGINEKKVVHAVAPTPYILKIDNDKCVGCGLCAKNCQISAIEINDGNAKLDESNCLGCGGCVKYCPNDALTLEPRKKSPKTPKNMKIKFIKIALEKGRLLKLALPSLKSKFKF